MDIPVFLSFFFFFKKKKNPPSTIAPQKFTNDWSRFLFILFCFFYSTSPFDVDSVQFQLNILLHLSRMNKDMYLKR